MLEPTDFSREEVDSTKSPMSKAQSGHRMNKMGNQRTPQRGLKAMCANRVALVADLPHCRRLDPMGGTKSDNQCTSCLDSNCEET